MPVVNTCDDPLDWSTSTNAIISLDTVDFITAPGSIKAEAPLGEFWLTLSHWFSPAVDWFTDPIFSFFLKASDPTKETNLRISSLVGGVLQDDYYLLPVTNTLQQIKVDLRTASTSGTVPNLSAIRHYGFNHRVANEGGTINVDQIETEAPTAIPTHILSLSSTPILGIPGTFRGDLGEVSYVTPWSGSLDEGTYEIDTPSNVLDGPDTYNFVQWEDGSTNPVRTIVLDQDLSLSASYQLVVTSPTKGHFQVNAFVGGVEVAADGLLVEMGHAFVTPDTIEVDPGHHTIRLTYGQITKDYPRDIVAGQSLRVDGQLAPPIRRFSPWNLLPWAVGVVLISRKGKK